MLRFTLQQRAVLFQGLQEIRSQNPHLEVTQQVLEGRGVGNDGGLVAAVDRPHQREGEVEDVTVEQRALLLQEHSQQLPAGTQTTNLFLFTCFIS